MLPPIISLWHAEEGKARLAAQADARAAAEQLEAMQHEASSLHDETRQLRHESLLLAEEASTANARSCLFEQQLKSHVEEASKALGKLEAAQLAEWQVGGLQERVEALEVTLERRRQTIEDLEGQEGALKQELDTARIQFETQHEMADQQQEEAVARIAALSEKLSEALVGEATASQELCKVQSETAELRDALQAEQAQSAEAEGRCSVLSRELGLCNTALDAASSQCTALDQLRAAGEAEMAQLREVGHAHRADCEKRCSALEKEVAELREVHSAETRDQIQQHEAAVAKLCDDYADLERAAASALQKQLKQEELQHGECAQACEDLHAQVAALQKHSAEVCAMQARLPDYVEAFMPLHDGLQDAVECVARTNPKVSVVVAACKQKGVHHTGASVTALPLKEQIHAGAALIREVVGHLNEAAANSTSACAALEEQLAEQAQRAQGLAAKHSASEQEVATLKQQLAEQVSAIEEWAARHGMAASEVTALEHQNATLSATQAQFCGCDEALLQLHHALQSVVGCLMRSSPEGCTAHATCQTLLEGVLCAAGSAGSVTTTSPKEQIEAGADLIREVATHLEVVTASSSSGRAAFEERLAEQAERAIKLAAKHSLAEQQVAALQQQLAEQAKCANERAAKQSFAQERLRVLQGQLQEAEGKVSCLEDSSTELHQQLAMLHSTTDEVRPPLLAFFVSWFCLHYVGFALEAMLVPCC
jgi:chromosome segregation ATPase